MAFKEVSNLDAEITISLGGTNRKTGKANPSRVEGYYMGSKTVSSPKSKGGVAKLHIFQTSKGNVGVWGKTDLDRKLASATVGALTRAEHTGMKPTKNGDMYSYKVLIDLEDTIEVVQNNSEAGSVSETENEDLDFMAESEDDQETEVDAEEAPLDEAPVSRPVRQVRTVAASKASVEALLNRTRK